MAKQAKRLQPDELPRRRQRQLPSGKAAKPPLEKGRLARASGVAQPASRAEQPMGKQPLSECAAGSARPACGPAPQSQQGKEGEKPLERLLKK